MSSCLANQFVSSRGYSERSARRSSKCLCSASHPASPEPTPSGPRRIVRPVLTGISQRPASGMNAGNGPLRQAAERHLRIIVIAQPGDPLGRMIRIVPSLVRDIDEGTPDGQEPAQPTSS